MKVEDIDIDPFCDYDKPDVQPDEPMSETIPLTPGGVGEDLLASQNEKHHLKEQLLERKSLESPFE